ncbi:MAG: response regulator transcription factor [Bacteroidales bacterium]|jgi:two-component system alkaline phosphatase synthesis response regulator PhoP|nr:response regulator transcription factor [Bacteroidales bacterium]NLK81317.1 response regulator transcription factor [Bacteroidales bacterium]HPY82060.1 response regulator transcription factor [Bacteroidales bacterium]
MTRHKVLIVDDEEDIVEILQYNLQKAGYIVFVAKDGREALKKAVKHQPDLVLLDIMMPVMDGIQTCEKMRMIPELQKTIIVFLTARGEDLSEIAGFQAGGDDYIMKPIRPKVLVTRIQSLLRRLKPIEEEKQPQTIEFEHVTILLQKHQVLYKNKEVYVPNKEFKLLVLLASKPERVFTREEIYNAVWGTDIIVGDRTIDVHIRKLREKIENSYIHTVKGVGYTFYKRE